MTAGSAFTGFRTVRPGQVLSGWWRRVWAFMFDHMLAGLLGGAIFALGGHDGQEPVFDRYLLAGCAVYVLYSVVGHGGQSGQTLGKKIFGIAVAGRMGEPIGYGRALGRFFAWWIVAVIPIVNLLSYLRPLWEQRKRTLHDSLAKTIVIRVR